MSSPRDVAVEHDPSGRYVRYKRVLGRGSFKTVYEAFDTVEALEVAWNKLHVDRLSELERGKIMNEVSLLGQIEHKNIIRLYSSFPCREADSDTDDSIAFITEQMMSGTLKEFLKKAQIVKLKVIRKWSSNILEAIAYLHERHIMHRDMKLDNLFVNGHVGEVKIGDLGLSAVRNAEHKAESVIGTPEFMAPELYEESYTEKVDVYAFGMCLLEMVTMEYPYSECRGPAQIMRKVFNGEKPDSFHRLVECDVKDVIAKCLEREPNRPSAAELLQHPLFRDWASDDGTDSNLSLMREPGQILELAPGTPGRDQMMNGAIENAPTIEFSEHLNRDVLVETREAVEVPDGEDDPGVSVEPTNVVGAGFKLNLQWPIADGLKRVEFTFNPGDRAEDLAREMVAAFELAPSQLCLLTEEIDSKIKIMEEQEYRLSLGPPSYNGVSADGHDEPASLGSDAPVGNAVVMERSSEELVSAGHDPLNVAGEARSGFSDSVLAENMEAGLHADGSGEFPPRSASVPPQVPLSVSSALEHQTVPQPDLQHSRSLSPPMAETLRGTEIVDDGARQQHMSMGERSISADFPLPDSLLTSGVDREDADILPADVAPPPIELERENSFPLMNMDSHGNSGTHLAGAGSSLPDYNGSSAPQSPYPVQQSHQRQSLQHQHQHQHQHQPQAQVRQQQQPVQAPVPRPAAPARNIVVVEPASAGGRESGSRPVSSRESSRPVSSTGPISRSGSDLDGLEAERGVLHPHSTGDVRMHAHPDALSNRAQSGSLASVALPPQMPAGIIPGALHDDASAGPPQASQGTNPQAHIMSTGLPKQTSPRGAHVTATTPSNLSMRTSSFRSMQSDDSLGQSSLLSPTQSVQTVPPVSVQSSMPQLGSSASAASSQANAPPSAAGENDEDRDQYRKWYTLCLELMYNASRGRLPVVKQKLDQGAAVNFADYDQRTPLHLAAGAGSLATLNVLLEAGANVNAQDRWGGTPIQDALSCNHEEVVLRLEEAGATRESDLDGIDATDKPSIELVQFSSDGNLAAVKERVASGVSVHVVDYDQRTPLHFACSGGHADVVDFLLLNGASAVAKDGRGRTPVENAVKNGHRHVLEVLKRCADSDPPLHSLLTELPSPNNGSAVVPAAPPAAAPLTSPHQNPPLSSTGFAVPGVLQMNGNGHAGASRSLRPKSTPPNAEQLERMRTEIAAVSHSISMGHIGIASDGFVGILTDPAGHPSPNEQDRVEASSQSLPPTPYETDIGGDDVEAERARLEEEYVLEKARLDEEHRVKVASLERKKTVKLHRATFDAQSVPSVSPQNGVPSLPAPVPSTGRPHAHVEYPIRPGGHPSDIPAVTMLGESATFDHIAPMSRGSTSVSADGTSSGQQTPSLDTSAGPLAPALTSRGNGAEYCPVPTIDVQVPLYDSSGGEQSATHNDGSGSVEVGASIVEILVKDASVGLKSAASATEAEDMH